MNERIVNLPGAFIPMAEARGLQAQSLVTLQCFAFRKTESMEQLHGSAYAIAVTPRLQGSIG